MRNSLASLTDAELTRSLKSLVAEERNRAVDILKHLNEMDRRKVAEKSGFPSLFEYCVRELRYINGTAARLIHAARAARKYEILYKTMERGLLSVTTVSMLAPHLTWRNHRRLVRAAAGKSAREVEALVSELSPVPFARTERIRFVAVAAAPSPAAVEDLFAKPIENADIPSPAPDMPSPPAPPMPPDAAANPPAPLVAARRVEFTFTGDESLWRDVERVKQLSRHKWPAGQLEDVFAGAVKALLDRIDPDLRRRKRDRGRRLSVGRRSRDIPQAVKDEVWRRDGGRCVYAAPAGRVCGARGGLQFDHVLPWALGGSGDASNIRLLCRAHNGSEARRVFGDAKIDAAIDASRGPTAPAAGRP